MLISWLGEAGLRIQTKAASAVVDPPAAETGSKPGQLAADVVALSQAEHRDRSLVTGQPLVINTPGEYELLGLFFYGLALPSESGRVHWRIEAEGLSLGHVADLNHQLDNGELSQLEGVDILFVPVGGKRVLNAEQAAALISQIEPRVVVPIQYHFAGSRFSYAAVDPFLKEFGAKNISPIPKLKITTKDLPAEETQVVVLQP
ncbi:MAG: MBL fold metallo-hydrolase [Candidatus Kerfeldbacteria bacterium]|nr:MBL fold metallo-hydrolase [Candidatus Kerfeldbacteria bacterium]